MATGAGAPGCLALRDEDGQWAGGAYFPLSRGACRRGAVQRRPYRRRRRGEAQPWTATTVQLLLLRDFGVDPQDDQVRETVALVRQPLPLGGGRPTVLRRRGRAVHQRDDCRARRVLRTSRRRCGGPVAGRAAEDGGWNCWAAYGSRRSSFATTINVLEGLLAHEQSTGGSAEAVAARRRGDELPPRTRALSAQEHCRDRRSRTGCSSRFRPAGTTTSSGLWSTSDHQAMTQTRA